MRLNLMKKSENEKTPHTLSITFCEVGDRRDCNQIREARMPVSKAMELARRRAREQGYDLLGWFPSPIGVALEGLK